MGVVLPPPLCYNIRMEHNPHVFSLTRKQTAKLQDAVGCFFASAKVCNPFDPRLLLLISGLHSAILEERALEQHHIDILVWIMDLLFLAMDETEYDPQLERVYHKFTGYWPTSRPWYERVKDNDSKR